MDTKLLIDAIVRQTTVLIAQLSTAAGIRAPLAHVADRIFVELAQEIERQGVGHKVVADMFGMALRTYQKRVQRLSESTTARGRTLWKDFPIATADGLFGRVYVMRHGLWGTSLVRFAP
jgi:predicted acetyltransferase